MKCIFNVKSEICDIQNKNSLINRTGLLYAYCLHKTELLPVPLYLNLFQLSYNYKKKIFFNTVLGNGKSIFIRDNLNECLLLDIPTYIFL